MPGSVKRRRCECADIACHETPKGPIEGRAVDAARCANVGRLRTLKRIDMEDHTGTRFCSHCANDAMESGLFTEAR